MLFVASDEKYNRTVRLRKIISQIRGCGRYLASLNFVRKVKKYYETSLQIFDFENTSCTAFARDMSVQLDMICYI